MVSRCFRGGCPVSFGLPGQIGGMSEWFSHWFDVSMSFLQGVEQWFVVEEFVGDLR